MYNSAWSIAVIFTGSMQVGLIMKCAVQHAKRPVDFSDVAEYSLLLIGPYLLCAIACRLSESRPIRVFTVLITLAGSMTVGVVLAETWRGPPKHLPLSFMLCAVVLVPQYWGGVILMIVAIVQRIVRARTASRVP